jgi:hypothetical protein
VLLSGDISATTDTIKSTNQNQNQKLPGAAFHPNTNSSLQPTAAGRWEVEARSTESLKLAPFDNNDLKVGA